MTKWNVLKKTERALSARKLTSLKWMDEDQQLSWVLDHQPSNQGCSSAEQEHLNRALLNAVSKRACIEFIYTLMKEGASPFQWTDDGQPLWKKALVVDADQPAGMETGWIILAYMNNKDRCWEASLLNPLKAAYGKALKVIQDYHQEQNEWYEKNPSGGLAEDEFYLNMKYDSAFYYLDPWIHSSIEE